MLVSHRTTFMQAKNSHHQCVWKISNVNRLHTRILHIKTSDLLESLLLDPIDLYRICHLRWAGHVFRMPWNRLPRKMLSSRARSPGPRGCPKMTYGRSLKKSLKKSEINMARTCFGSLCMEKCNWKFESELVFIFLYLFWQFKVFSSFFIIIIIICLTCAVIFTAWL